MSVFPYNREALVDHLTSPDTFDVALPPSAEHGHGQPPMVQAFGDVQLQRIHEEIHNGAAPAGRDTADGRW